MWRVLRITVLLLVLLVVAGQAWLDRFSTTHWQHKVYVGAFPVSADESAATARYLAQLDQEKIDEVGDFIKAEAHRYGVAVDEPIELKLYPQLTSPPPALDPGAGVLTRILWSLKLRYYRSRALAAVSTGQLVRRQEGAVLGGVFEVGAGGLEHVRENRQVAASLTRLALPVCAFGRRH